MKKITIPILAAALLLVITLIFVLNKPKQKEMTTESAETINNSSELINSGKTEEARKLLEKSIKDDESNFLAHYNLGITYMKENKNAEAIEAFSRSIELKPNFGAYLNRAVCYKKSGKKSEAINDYTEVLSLNPDYSRAYLERGILYHSLGEMDKAKADLTTASQKGVNGAKKMLETLDL